MNSTSSEWQSIEPLLDEAMEKLDDPDRAAILLRFFENQPLREVGHALGISDDAAQKRVSRALEKLREFFAREGKTVAATALAGAISANAIQAAPAGLGLAISSAAFGSVAAVSVAIGATKTIAMTTMQKTFIGATLAAVVGTGIYGAHRLNQTRARVQSLEDTRSSLATQVARLSTENDRLSNKLQQASLAKTAPASPPTELLRLRGLANLNAQEIAALKTALAQGEKIPEPVVRILNKYFSAYIAGERQSAKSSALNRLQQLSEKLSLSPEQQQQVREIIMGHADARAEMAVAGFTGELPFEDVRARKGQIDDEESSALAALLSPEQVTAYEKMRADAAEEHYKNWARAMASQIKSPLNLDREQVQQVASILYGLKPGEGGENIPFYTNAREQIETRMQALQGVLSSEQLDGYRQRLLGDIEEHNQIAQITRALKQ